MLRCLMTLRAWNSPYERMFLLFNSKVFTWFPFKGSTQNCTKVQPNIQPKSILSHLSIAFCVAKMMFWKHATVQHVAGA